MFDAYCKQVLRNALVDYLRKKNYLSEHEIPTGNMDSYIDIENGFNERSWETVLYINFEGESFPIENETLHKALSTLSERHIGVLLLKYWHRLNDSQIASHFHISERTVRNWRKSAIARVQKWYQDNHVVLDYPSRQD